MDADLILANGVIYTVDVERSRHEALAVKDGRIIAVGSAAQVAGHRGRRTQTVDLGGRLVLPGFCDAHLHVLSAVTELFEASLAECRTADDCLDVVARFAAEHPELPFIRGYGWYATKVPMDGMTAEALDRAVPDRPAMLCDDSVHAQWVNSDLLRRTGIGWEEPDWPGAVVERLPDGSPKGLFHEAFPWLERAIPQYTVEQRVRAFGHFRREIASRYGLTLLHEAGVNTWDTVLDAYERLEQDDELGLRLRLAVMFDPDRPAAEQVERAAAVRARFDGPLVKAATAKFFADGVAETRTAYLAEPYDDCPGFRGEPVWAPQRLVEASCAAAEAGFQLHYHVIGDAALSLALEAIEAARGGRNVDARDLVTHVQFADPRDYARMAAAGVVAVMQPYWQTKEPEYDALMKRLVGARADRMYPMRSLLDAGVTVAAASDYPVSPPPDPLLAIQRGVLRRDPLTGVDTELWPDEAVSAEDMVQAFTIAGARANFLERETGSLEVGKSADLIVLREDLFALPPEHINEATVELTLFRGQPTFATGPFAGLDAD